MRMRGGGSSTVALVVMLMLSACLAVTARSKTRDALLSTLQSINQSMTQPMDECHSLPILTTVGAAAPRANGW